MDKGMQAVDVGAFQLCEHTVFEDFRRQRVEVGKGLEHFVVRRKRGLCLLHGWQIELVEEDADKLLRGVDIERIPGSS